MAFLKQNKSLSRQNMETSASAGSTAVNYSHNMNLQIKAGGRVITLLGREVRVNV